MGVVAWIALGLVAGLVARALLPGRAPRGVVLTAVLGILGALLGGALGHALGLGGIDRFFDLRTWLLAIAGSVVVFVVFGLLTRRRSRLLWRW